MTSWDMRFALANAIAIALVLVAGLQTPAGGPEDVPASIVRKYLPFALAIAARCHAAARSLRFATTCHSPSSACSVQAPTKAR